MAGSRVRNAVGFPPIVPRSLPRFRFSQNHNKEIGMPEQSLEQLCINTIRFLSADGVQQANSGHPGLPMGTAPMAYTIWTRHLRHNPANPAWPNRDRFILSGGHGSMLLYCLLHLTGYDLPLDELKRFRQWGSLTPGHPEVRADPRRRDDHRPARTGLCQRRRHGDRRSAPGGRSSTAPAMRSSTTTSTPSSPTAT